MSAPGETWGPRYDELGVEGRLLHDAIMRGPRADVAGQFLLQDEAGRLAGPFGLFLLSPAVGMPLQQLGARLRIRVGLSDRERELATLACAFAAGSAFEIAAHTKLALAAGVSAAEIEALRDGKEPECSREAAFVRLSSALVADVDPRRPFEDALASTSPREAFEVVVLAGYYRTLASMLAPFSAGTDEEE